jgi:hypothetical protein
LGGGGGRSEGSVIATKGGPTTTRKSSVGAQDPTMPMAFQPSPPPPSPLPPPTPFVPFFFVRVGGRQEGENTSIRTLQPPGTCGACVCPNKRIDVTVAPRSTLYTDGGRAGASPSVLIVQ